MTTDVYNLRALELVGLHTAAKAKSHTMKKGVWKTVRVHSFTIKPRGKELCRVLGWGEIRVQWLHGYLGRDGGTTSYMSTGLLGHDC